MQSTRTKNYRDPKRWNTVSVPERVAERAYSKHEVNEDGCWISTYSVANHGYAQVGWQEGAGKRHVVLAHRAAWVRVNGQVPIGMTLDHTCKVRRCVNPSHLRLLSNYENARRNFGHDWEFGTCRKGHPDTELIEVPRKAKSGRRYMGLACGVCYKAHSANWAANNPDKRAATIERDKEKSKARAKAWYQANKELTKRRAREWKAASRAKKAAAPQEIPCEYV